MILWLHGIHGLAFSPITFIEMRKWDKYLTTSWKIKYWVGTYIIKPELLPVEIAVATYHRGIFLCYISSKN